MDFPFYLEDQNLKKGDEMDLYQKLEKVNTREDFISFIQHLRANLQTHRDEWENVTLDQYLEAMEAWVSDMDGYDSITHQPNPKQPSWKTIADMLYASRMYE